MVAMTDDTDSISSVDLTHFGPINKLEWDKLGKINLIIGGNGSGKTLLLKALYSAMRTLETYKRGNDQRSAVEILFDKLYWTFQVDKLGELVTKGAVDSLSFNVMLGRHSFSYTFAKGHL